MSRCIQICFSFCERILPEYHTRDVGLSNSMARPMKLRCCVFNKVFLVNHWRDTLNCIAVGPSYLVSMPGEAKYHTSGLMCNLSWTHKEKMVSVSDALVLFPGQAREKRRTGSVKMRLLPPESLPAGSGQQWIC